MTVHKTASKPKTVFIQINRDAERQIKPIIKKQKNTIYIFSLFYTRLYRCQHYERERNVIHPSTKYPHPVQSQETKNWYLTPDTALPRFFRERE